MLSMTTNPVLIQCIKKSITRWPIRYDSIQISN